MAANKGSWKLSAEDEDAVARDYLAGAETEVIAESKLSRPLCRCAVQNISGR